MTGARHNDVLCCPRCDTVLEITSKWRGTLTRGGSTIDRKLVDFVARCPECHFIRQAHSKDRVVAAVLEAERNLRAQVVAFAAHPGEA